MSKRSSQFERRENSYYPSPLEAYTPLFPFLSGDTGICDPCAGDGRALDYLVAEGHRIALASDLDPRREDVIKMNALDYTQEHVKAHGIKMFITNPPWPAPEGKGGATLPLAMIRVLSSLCPTWFLLPADMMHTKYAPHTLAYCSLIISVGRVKWIEDSAHTSMDNCCWYKFVHHKVGFTRFINLPKSSVLNRREGLSTRRSQLDE